MQSAKQETREAQACQPCTEKSKKIADLDHRMSSVKQLIEKAKSENDLLKKEKKELEKEKKELEDTVRKLQRKLKGGESRQQRSGRESRCAVRRQDGDAPGGAGGDASSSIADEGFVAGRNPSVMSDSLAVGRAAVLSGDEGAGTGAREGIHDISQVDMTRTESISDDARPASWSPQNAERMSEPQKQFGSLCNGHVPPAWPDSDDGAYSISSAGGGGPKTPISKSPIHGEAATSPLEPEARADRDAAHAHHPSKETSDGPSSVPSSLGGTSPIGGRSGGMLSVNSNGSVAMRTGTDIGDGDGHWRARCRYLEMELEDIENRYTLQVDVCACMHARAGAREKEYVLGCRGGRCADPEMMRSHTHTHTRTYKNVPP